MPNIEIFADSEPVTDETRKHCRLWQGTNWQFVEIWVDDKLVFETPKEPKFVEDEDELSPDEKEDL